MRSISTLAAVIGLSLSTAATAVNLNSKLYGVYKVAAPANTLYVIPKRSLNLSVRYGGLVVPVPFMPKVPGYQMTLNADGSIGAVTTTTYTSATISALNPQPSSYKLQGGDFNGDGQFDLLVQAGAGSSSFILASDPVSQAVGVYYNFNNALGSAQQVSIADVDGNGRADVATTDAQGNKRNYLSSSFGPQFSAVDVTPDLSNQPAAPLSDSAACYANGTEMATKRPQDLDVTDKLLVDTADKRIAQLAQQLGYSPVRIFEYVSNNIAYELYAGTVKGAAGTLIAGSGNDVDQAALTVALLRASKIPARFVKGSIYIENKPQHLDWLQVKSITAAVNSLLRNGITAGSGTTINGRTAFPAGHVWAEACVPYSNYRGTVADQTGHRWVPFDASFKTMKRNDGVTHTATFDYASYLAHLTNDLPADAYDKKVLANVKLTDPNLTLDDVGTRWDIQPVHYEFLPDTLPYQVANFVAWDNGSGPSDVADVPTNWYAKFNLSVTTSGAAKPSSPQVVIDMVEAVKSRVTLAFELAGSDQTAMNNFRKGLGAFPCGQSVVPVIRVGGAEVYRGGSFAACDANNKPTNLGLYLDVAVNGAQQNKAAYTNIAVQDYYALQAYGFQASEEYLAQHYSKLLNAIEPAAGTPWADADNIVGEYLNLVLSKYMRYSTDGMRHIGRLNNDTGTAGMHIGLTRTNANVIYVFDLPFALGSNSFIVDAAGLLSTGTQITTGASQLENFKLGGYNISALETFVWRENALKDAVSTVTGLQVANEKGIQVPVLTTAGLTANPNLVDTTLVKCTATPNNTTLVTQPSPYPNYYQFAAGVAAKTVVDSLRSLGISDDNTLANILSPQYQGLLLTLYSAVVKIPVLTASAIDTAIATESTYCYSAANIQSLKTELQQASTTITIPKSPVKFPIPSKTTDGLSWLPNWVGQLFVIERSNNIGFIIGSFNGGITVPTPTPALYGGTSIFNTGYDVSSVPSYVVPTGINSLNNNANTIINTVSSAVGNGVSNFSSWGGDPVNMVTGNLYHEETDFSLPARGLPIAFQRTYNSRDDKDCTKVRCPLGPTWTHSFNQYLTFSAPPTGTAAYRTATWVDGSGAKKFIQLKSTPAAGVAKTWQGADVGIPAGFYFAASANFTANMATGTVTITERSGVSYLFRCLQAMDSCVARLESITDRNGNALALTYDGSNRLWKVTDPSSRVLTFAYDTANRLSTITDWDNRTFGYQYDSNSNLTDVYNALGVKVDHYNYYGSADGPNANRKLKQYSYTNGVQMNFEYYPNGKVYRHYDALGNSTVFTYNDYLREATMVDPRGNTQKYAFNKDGVPTRITELDGGVWQYKYEDAANPILKTSVIDPMGYETRYAYDASGNNTTVTLPSKIGNGSTNDTIVNSYFDTFGQPQLVKNAQGDYTLNVFDPKGNLKNVITFKRGIGAAINPSTYVPVAADILAWAHTEYDSYGNVTKTQKYRDFTNKIGPYTTFDYTDTVNSVSGIAPVITTYYGDLNNDGVIAAGEGLGAYTTQYDKFTRVRAGFNKALYPITATYDKQGRVLSATDDNGNVREYSYDANGLPTGTSLTVSTNGAAELLDQTTVKYDAAGRKVAATDATGAVTAYAYDENGNLTQLTTADGYAARSTYDAANRLATTYDAAGHTIRREYDLAGRIKTETDPNGNVKRSVYYGPEKAGRLKQQIEAADANDAAAPSGRITTFDYDALGNVTDVTDHLGRMTHTDYDPLGRPVRIVGPIVADANLGISVRPVTRYTYNNLGDRIRLEVGYTTLAANYTQNANASADVLATQMTYVYDDFGRLLSQTDAALHTWSFGYDTHGNVTTSTDALNQVSTYAYEYGGMLKSRTTSTAAGQPGDKVTYTRNVLGQVVEAVTNDSYYTYRYDAAHRLQSVNDLRGNKSLSYNYSIGGLLNGVVESDGNNIDFAYDPVGRVTGIRAQNNTTLSYFYDDGGRLAQKAFPNGVRSTYSYFNSGRVQSIATRDGSNVVFDQNDYTYDGAGNVLTAKHQLPTLPNTPISNVQNLRFTHDAQGRLTTVQDAQTNGLIEQAAYDAYGNRVSWTPASGGTTQYYIANGLQQVTEIHGGSKTGTLLYSYQYDLNGNLKQQVTASNGATLGFTYDTWDRTTGVADGATTEAYRYDHSGRRIQKTVNGSAIQYLYNGNNLIAEYGAGWSAPTAQYAYGLGVDDPLVRFGNGAARFYHGDTRGSVTSVTDGNGMLAGGFHYSAWGTPQSVGGTGLPDFTYAGREPIAAGGLVYMRARIYMPMLGRFTQLDPAGFVDGVNRYAYVRNSPLNFRDPSGRVASLNNAALFSQSYTTPSIQLNLPDANSAAKFNALISNGYSTTCMMNCAKTDYAAQQMALDMVAMSNVPFVQQAAAAGSAAISISNGDYLGAGLAVLGGIPGVGLETNAAKIGTNATRGVVIIGETMARVDAVAARIPGAITLNNMPNFAAMGQNANQVTSSMMQYNRVWILDQMRSGNTIIDIGRDPKRLDPSIFYQMEQNMIKNYQTLHPEWNAVIKH